MNKPTTFEDYLKEIHAREYMGTDDNMPDAFDGWLENVQVGDLIAYAEIAIKVAFVQGIERGGDMAVQTLRQ